MEEKLRQSKISLELVNTSRNCYKELAKSIGTENMFGRNLMAKHYQNLHWHISHRGEVE